MSRMTLEQAVDLIDNHPMVSVRKPYIEAWKVIQANIKEARPTVRAKRPVQQLRRAIALYINDLLDCKECSDKDKLDSIRVYINDGIA